MGSNPDLNLFYMKYWFAVLMMLQLVPLARASCSLSYDGRLISITRDFSYNELKIFEIDIDSVPVAYCSSRLTFFTTDGLYEIIGSFDYSTMEVSALTRGRVLLAKIYPDGFSLSGNICEQDYFCRLTLSLDRKYFLSQCSELELAGIVVGIHFLHMHK